MSASNVTVDEMRRIAGEAVAARRDRGRAEAIHQAARDLGLNPRRILGIIRGEVSRVWADELASAKAWEANFCARQAEILAHEAAVFKARASALEESLK